MSGVQLDEIILNVEERGSGPPLLLVHGFPLDHSMWLYQIEELAESFHVIAPDLRGFGESGGQDESILTMERFADDLDALIEALSVDEPVIYCGLSMGGYIAWEFWRRHRARVGGLVLCDTRAAADSPEAARTRLETADRVENDGTEGLALVMTEKLFCEKSRRGQVGVVEATRDVMASSAPVTVAAALRGMAQRSDSTNLLETLDVPTLAICGEHDSLTAPEEMRGMSERIRGCHFAAIADAGHLSPLENPKAVNAEILKWWETVSPK